MARTKVTIRKKGGHSEEDMLRAVLLKRQGKSIRKAAKECNVPYATLFRYVKKYKNVDDAGLPNVRLTPNYDVNRTFTVEQEKELKAYIEDCALKFYGLGSRQVRRVAYQMAKVNNIQYPTSWDKDQRAGIEWLRSFKLRHPELRMKKPEACSMARATAFNKETVRCFFNNLKNVMDRHPSFGNGCRVYNLDETATTTVQRPQRVMGPKGKHNICKITSGERGVLVTTCAIVCASGQALPPALVFPRKTFKDHMMNGAPPGSLGLASPTGWMNAELFVEVMRHFIKHTSSSPENPSLIIMDNHESHLSIQALDLAKQAGVTVLTLHPHTTAKMQPLDVGLNAPFKGYYNGAIDSWMMRNPGKLMTIYSVAECVGQAYAKAMTPVNIASAFKKCGIFPFDPDVFTEIDFMPSLVTDREQLIETASDELHPVENLAVARTENCLPDVIRTESPSILELDEFIFENTSAQITKAREMTPPVQECASVSGVKTNFKSPMEFMAPFKAGPRTGKRKSRKLGKSMVATDTPEKDRIADERKKTKERKLVAKTISQPAFSNKRGKKKPKMAMIDLESSEEDEDVVYMEEGDSDISEFSEELDEDGLPLVTEDFKKLTRSPKEGDYVLVLLDANKLKVFYVARITEVINTNKFVASFMRLKVKDNMKFHMPLEPDLSEIHMKEIKMILPLPQINGSKLRNSTYVFPVRVTPNMKLR